MNMVKSHLLSRSTLSSAIIGVVPKEDGTNEGKDEDRTCMHSVGTAGNDCVLPCVAFSDEETLHQGSWCRSQGQTGLVQHTRC